VISVDSTGRLEPVFDLVDRFVTEEGVDGAAVAVALGGDQVAEHYAGNAAAGRPATVDTLWPLASISKVYTAAAVMTLVERGVLTLNTTVKSVLPECDGGGREEVTLRQLLTHTAGFVYESPEMEQRLLDQWTIEQITDEAFTYPLEFAPGTRHSYSDYGYAVAGRVAAQAAGMSFPDLVRTTVLEPGGLRDTYMPSPPSESARLAHVVGPLAYGTSGDMYNSPYALGLAHPAFGTVATVRDLLRFGLLFAPRGSRHILSNAGVRLMTTDQTGGHTLGLGNSPTPVSWAIGFAVKGANPGYDLGSPALFGHGGATGCTLQIDPVHDVTVAFVSNKHSRAGRAAMNRRRESIVSVALACLTRR
jgi:CubicO group peptidase (beta-lactamase class C family)